MSFDGTAIWEGCSFAAGIVSGVIAAANRARARRSARQALDELLHPDPGKRRRRTSGPTACPARPLNDAGMARARRGGKGHAMRDDPAVIALVARARDGDQHAWDELVDRYAPLVWSICNRYQLNRHDIDDVGQTVWLLLVEQLGNLRQPAALPGWLATTTQRECLRVLRAARRYDHSGLPEDSQMSPDQPAVMIEQEVIAAELNAALRAAFAELPAPLPAAAVDADQRPPAAPMLRSAPPCRYPSAASARSVPAAWTGCAAPPPWPPSATATSTQGVTDARPNERR